MKNVNKRKQQNKARNKQTTGFYKQAQERKHETPMALVIPEINFPSQLLLEERIFF